MDGTSHLAKAPSWPLLQPDGGQGRGTACVLLQVKNLRHQKGGRGSPSPWLFPESYGSSLRRSLIHSFPSTATLLGSQTGLLDTWQGGHFQGHRLLTGTASCILMDIL